MGGGISCVYIEQFCLYIKKKLLQSPFSDIVSLGNLDQLSMSNAYTNQLHSVLSLLWFCEGGGRQNKRILCNFKLFKAPWNLKSEITQYTNFKYMFGPNGQMWYPMAIWLFKVQELKKKIYLSNTNSNPLKISKKRPMSHIAHLINNTFIVICFMLSNKKHMDN